MSTKKSKLELKIEPRLDEWIQELRKVTLDLGEWLSEIDTTQYEILEVLSKLRGLPEILNHLEERISKLEREC